jgi:predicted site-specific integrase-resolvase
MQRLFPGREVISDIASGVNFERPGLLKLIERINNDEIESIAISYKDRLARIGFDIIEYICRLHGCAIVIVNEINTSPESELVEDLIAITTSFSARIHGLRKYSAKIDKNFTQKITE